MSTAFENHSFMMQLLDKAYDAAVSGSVPGTDSAEDLALIGEDLIDLEAEKRKVDPKSFMSFIKE